MEHIASWQYSVDNVVLRSWGDIYSQVGNNLIYKKIKQYRENNKLNPKWLCAEWHDKDPCSDERDFN